MRLRNRVARPRATRGGATETEGLKNSNELSRYKVSRGPKLSLCERCGQRLAELLVIGEREGMAVRICRACRGTSRYPMFLRSGRRKGDGWA